MLKGRTPTERIVAALHDVVEDSEWTMTDLRAEGFTEEILQAVDALTWRKGDHETYEEFIARAARNSIARRVKLADIDDNMDLRRIANPGPKDHNRLNRYAWAKALQRTGS